MYKELGLATLIGVGLLVGQAFVNGTSKKDREAQAQLRKKLEDSLNDGIITKTEYNMIWDLTTERKLDLAEYYYKTAIGHESNEEA